MKLAVDDSGGWSGGGGVGEMTVVGVMLVVMALEWW